MAIAAMAGCTSAYAAGTTPVPLGKARPFAIASQTGVTDVRSSAVTGNVGVSPITGAADHLACTEVTGRVYSVDAAGPAPCSIKAPAFLRSVLSDTQGAYANAAARTPSVTELGAGNIGGLTLAPGVYHWSSAVIIPTNVTLAGKANDVWIFQIAQTLNLSSGTAVQLSGGARAKNVFWQVAGKVTLGTTSHFEGTILGKTLIAVKTGASVTGRLFAQTAVTLEQNAITKPTN